MIYLFKISAGDTQTETVHHTPLYFCEKEERIYRQTGQGKFVPDQSMEVNGTKRGTAPFILDLGAIRGSWITSSPGRFNARKDPLYLLNEKLDEP